MIDESQLKNRVPDLLDSFDADAVGRELYDRIRLLYPICRSITGDGVRETLRLIGAEIDLEVHEVPSGTPVLDWVVPKEWNIRDAYIADGQGRRIVDFKASNLHVVNYSRPIHARMPLAELRPHLHSIPEHPDWIPYKTSYYKETWGFCLPDRQLSALQDGEYEVMIDSSLEDGHLTLAECVLPGREDDEVLLSSHICHPSLCNDNLSSVSIAVTLAKLLRSLDRRYTYRLVFAPGTIGAITWLALNERNAPKIKHGLVLATLGDRGAPTYKRSRRHDAAIDRAVAHVLQHSGHHQIKDFSPYGYDERQYCSPGFNLPVGVLSRTQHGCYPEYHTSADNLELMDPAALADSFVNCLKIIELLEGNRSYVNRYPKGEPMLGRRGLYSSMGGRSDSGRQLEAACLWVLNLSDGTSDLLDIAIRSGLEFRLIREAANALVEHGLIE